MTRRPPSIPEPIRAARFEVARIQARIDGLLSDRNDVASQARGLAQLSGDRLAKYQRYEGEYKKAVAVYNDLVAAHNAEVQRRKDARRADAERKTVRSQMCPSCFTVHAGDCA